MVYGANWTGARVLERLISFFAADTGVALRAETGDLFPADKTKPVDGLDVVRAALKVLGPRSEAAQMLLTRARTAAKGLSVADLCQETGWAPATLNRRVATASEDVATWLNWRHEVIGPLDGDKGREASSAPTSN